MLGMALLLVLLTAVCTDFLTHLGARASLDLHDF
jgi:hypothetical protein